MTMQCQPGVSPDTGGDLRDIIAAKLTPVYRAMLASRLVDQREAELVRRGEAFFHISGEGHEALAALAAHLVEADWLACHYRDKALMIFRGLPLVDLFATQLCRASGPSGGRQLPDILCAPQLNILSLPVPVGNHALHAVGVAAHQVQSNDAAAITVCLAGDGTTQQGEFLEAMAEAVRRHLPILFVVEDNRYAISTATEKMTFLSRPGGQATEFYGLPVRTIAGDNVPLAYRAFGRAVRQVRENRGPALVWFRTERLASHTNADQQSLYRSEADIRASHDADPIPHLERFLIASGVSGEKLDALRTGVVAEVEAAEKAALDAPDPHPVTTAKAPLPARLSDRSREYRGTPATRSLTMREAICDVLRCRLATDPRLFLTGQDIEDPKGDVFGVTRGLSTAFPGRVLNAALSESTIVGTCIGRALAGQRPVAFLQFADFLPLAFNQIASELGSMYWRTAAGYSCPVVVMIACGGYKPGLGPFHSQTFESISAHLPGIDVVMPSTAADAAGLLNAVLESPRPTLFFYPKALLNLPAGATSSDVEGQFVPIGVSRRIRRGGDLTLVAWGNSTGLSQRVAESLGEVGIAVDLIDLRSLSPWDETAVVESVEKTRRLLVVHEDNATCGFGAEVVAVATERVTGPLRARRVARPDTFVPCHYGNQLEILPSFRSTLAAAAELLDLELDWIESPPTPEGRLIVSAIGSGPSDEFVTVAELPAKVGETVRAGELVAVIEASKSVVEMVAPATGVVECVGAVPGDQVPLGHPLITLCVESPKTRLPTLYEPPATPRLRRRRGLPVSTQPAASLLPAALRTVGLGAIGTAVGNRVVSNTELLRNFSQRTSDDILRRTGIETRRWIGPEQNALSLAVDAARAALREAGLSVADLDLIVCSTGNPHVITPSMACLILAELAGDSGATPAAWDINAACSGYLYALEAAHNHLLAEPANRVMVVTAETPSTKLNVRDFDTAFLFGDAATATIVVGNERAGEAHAWLHRPVLSARGENGTALSVPLVNGDQFITMQGMDVYAEAVSSMAAILERACAQAGATIGDLDLIVPHQANQRILNAIELKLERPVYSNIRNLGNTSSSSIPLAILDAFRESNARRIGLCAFGGGFTYAGALVERTGDASCPERSIRSP